MIIILYLKSKAFCFGFNQCPLKVLCYGMCTNWLTDCSPSPWETFTRTRRHHCRASARNLDLSLALTWLLSRGEFFYSAKAYRCLDFSTERPVAFTSIVVRLVKKHVTFDNNYITFDLAPGTRFELSISQSRNWASAISTLWWIPKTFRPKSVRVFSRYL